MPDSVHPLAICPIARCSFQGVLQIAGQGRRMAHIEVAGSILLGEIGRVEHVASSYSRSLVGVPIHRVRVGIVALQAQAAVARTRDLDHCGLIGGVSPAHQFGDLLVRRIEAAPEAGNRVRRGPRSIERNGDLRALERPFAGVIDHVVGDGAGVHLGVEISVDGDGQAAAQACQGTGPSASHGRGEFLRARPGPGGSQDCETEGQIPLRRA